MINSWAHRVHILDTDSAGRIAKALYVGVESVLHKTGHLPNDETADWAVEELTGLIGRIH